MEEGKNKVEISYENMMALYQELSGKDVQYARLEMKHERLQEDFVNVKAQLAKTESERLEFAVENKILKEKVQLQEEEIHVLKAQREGRQDASPMSEKEHLQKTIVIMLEKYLLLSIEKVKAFMQTRDVNLPTASILRGFVEDTVPDELKAKLLESISSMMLLPGKPEPPKIEPTITGGQTFFGSITNSEFLGRGKDADE